ncbi:MAG: phage tail protein, partial [Proteobacteria bacterium]|nr:phage tail protein [Pseudomonadota bacterium]
MAEISRNMHKEEKRYLMPIAQINADLVDADVNDGYFMFFNQARRIQEVQGNGSPNNGFLVVGVDDNNTFMIKGGGGTNDTAGKMFNKGLSARLTGDIMYLGGSPTNPTLGGLKSFNPSTINALFLEDQFSIYPKVTSFSFDSGGNQTVIVDASANYTSDELVGRSIQVGLAGTLSTFAIVSNTATQIRLNGNQTGFFTLDDFYRITLTTPTANRNDGVYLNYWLKEISAAEDNELYHVLDVGVLEGQRRYKLIQTIHVVENDSNLFTDYQDSGAVYHYIFKIAEIHRLLGNPQITDSMVVDLRPRLKPNDQIGFPTLLQARAVVDDAGGPTNYVTVEPGWYADSINLVFVALGNRTTSPIFDPITTIGNVRYDLLSLDRNGTLVITQGNEIALPGNPYTTQFIPDMCSIAVIRITEDANVQISHDDITDYRDILLSLSSNSIDHQNTTNKQGDSPYYHISQDKYNALVDHGGFAIGATNHVANVDWVNSLLTGGQAVPTGGFLWFAAIYPPTGYHICDNSPYFINFYEALYDVIGSVYGLDDETTITFDSGSHILNAAGHTLANGDILELTTTGTLPTGLAISTKYFVV